MLTCEQVHQIIHSLPLIEYSPARIQAVESHARTCATCQADLDQVKAIDARLKSLAEPRAPVEMGAVILKSTAALGREKSPLAEPQLSHRPSPARDHLAGFALLAGVIVVMVAYWYQFLAGKFSLDLISLRTAVPGSLVGPSSVEPATLFLSLGLLLFLGGILAFEWETGYSKPRA